MKRYFVPNILSEVEFEDLKKKSEAGDAVAQLQLSLACDTELRKLAETMYAGDWRFYSEEQQKELRGFAYDNLHNAKTEGNMDALLLSAFVSNDRKRKMEALYESAKAGNDIAAYNLWAMVFKRYRYALREILDKISTEDIYSEALALLIRAADNGNRNAAYAAFMFYHLILINKRVLEAYTIRLPGTDGCSEKQLASACLKYLRTAAERGQSDAQLSLSLYYQGKNFIADSLRAEKDLRLAEYWLSRSVSQGNPYAYLHLGDVFRSGDGCEKNNNEAWKCYAKVVNVLKKSRSKRAYYDKEEKIYKDDYLEWDKELLQNAHRGMGDILHEKGDYAKALAHYKCVSEDKVFKYLKMMKRKGLVIPPLPEDYRP